MSKLHKEDNQLMQGPACQFQGLGSLCSQCVVVKFICQLDLAMGGPDILSQTLFWCVCVPR